MTDESSGRLLRRTLRAATMAAAAIASTVAIAAATALVPAQEPVLSITGRVVAAGTGRPINGARVSLGQADFILGSVSTDAAGVFQYRGLRPGRYRLTVSAPGYMTAGYGRIDEPGPLRGITLISISAARPTFNTTIELHRGATIAGRVVDDRKEPVVGVTVRAFTAQRVDGVERLLPIAGATADTDDRGDYRIYALPAGTYVVGALDQSVATFAPAATSAADASRIVLAEDAVRLAVNIQMRFPRGGAIEGLVSGPGAAGSPELTVRLRPQPAVPGLADRTIRPEPGGRFRFADVAAGRYLLLVQPGQRPGEPRTFGSTEVVVAPGPEAAPAIITLQEGARVTGRLTGDAPRIVEMMRLELSPLADAPPEAATVSARADADGRFTLSGIAPGRYRWRVCSGQQFDRMLCTVTHDGRDITDEPLTVAPDTRLEDVAIHARNAPGSLVGAVRSKSGEPVTAGAVIIASADPRHWTDATRRVVAVRPDTAGEFEVRVLPPGDYVAAHILTAPATALTDPAFLKRLTGTKVTVGTTGQHRVEVQISGQK